MACRGVAVKKYAVSAREEGRYTGRKTEGGQDHAGEDPGKAFRRGGVYSGNAGAASGRTVQCERGDAGIYPAGELEGKEHHAAHPAAGRQPAGTHPAGRKRQLHGGQGVHGVAVRQLDAAGTGGGRLPGADTAGTIRLLRDAGNGRRRGDQPDAVRDLCGAGAGVLEQRGDQRTGGAEQRRRGREGCEESRGGTDRNGDGGRTGRGGTESGRKRRSPGRGGSRSGGENGTGGRAGEERERQGRCGDPDSRGCGRSAGGQCGLCEKHPADRTGR